MSEREPIVEEGRMADERAPSDAGPRKAHMRKAGAREPGMRETAAHPAKSVSAKTMPAKTMSPEPSMATTTATVSASRRYVSRGTSNENSCRYRDHCLAHRDISMG
jgi:hypothetical protein